MIGMALEKWIRNALEKWIRNAIGDKTTTVAGVLAGVAIMLPALRALFDGDAGTEADIALIVTGVGIMLGLSGASGHTPEESIEAHSKPRVPRGTLSAIFAPLALVLVFGVGGFGCTSGKQAGEALHGSWVLIRPLAERGIEDMVDDGEIDEGAAGIMTETLDEHGETIDALRGVDSDG